MVFGAKFIIRRREKGPSVKGRQRRQTIFFLKVVIFQSECQGGQLGGSTVFEPAQQPKTEGTCCVTCCSVSLFRTLILAIQRCALAEEKHFIISPAMK